MSNIGIRVFLVNNIPFFIKKDIRKDCNKQNELLCKFHPFSKTLEPPLETVIKLTTNCQSSMGFLLLKFFFLNVLSVSALGPC